MKLKFAAAAVAVMLSQGAWALGEPQACPTVAQLQATGVTMAMQDTESQGQWWGITPSGKFGTNDDWFFAAGTTPSQSQQGVVDAINQKLSTLGEPKGPIDIDGNMFGCIYANQSQDFVGVAITPPIAMDSAMKFVRQVRRK